MVQKEFCYVILYRLKAYNIEKDIIMHKEFVMGNEAIALGAMAAGVEVVAGYPGTPSTEVLEAIAKRNNGTTYVEWSVNEKAGLEVAAAAAYAGKRTMVTMKQVGLNVASDPLMSLAYIGVKGGMVVMVADDPGPISSQTEQDTRTYGMFSKLPVFDPSSVDEAYEMIQTAFEVSEKYNTPVIFRSTTRVCHAYSAIDVKDKEEYYKREISGDGGSELAGDSLGDGTEFVKGSSTDFSGFVKDSNRWVIFPRLSYANHKMIEERLPVMGDELGELTYNKLIKVNNGRLGIACGGISYAYVCESVQELSENENKDDCNIISDISILKVGTPHPFPEKLAVRFLEGLEEVLVVEELDPVIERMLLMVAGKYHLKVKIRGKLTGDVKNAGENTVESVTDSIRSFVQFDSEKKSTDNRAEASTEDEKSNIAEDVPELPIRPPVLCAGCPHRASFYAVKQAMKGRKAIFCGDIGCYTLGNAKPLDMVDTCLCMGAGITMAQGFSVVEKDTTCFAFVGDSTFFASGITGVVNAVYNQHDMVLIVLDNSTTAMTGHQPHPGTGKTVMGDIVEKVSIEKILEAVGVADIRTVNPLDLKISVDTVKELADKPGVKAVIFKSPCIALFKPDNMCVIDSEKCINCKKCINELGCPAITVNEGSVVIEPSLCTGCGLCTQVCPVGAIS